MGEKELMSEFFTGCKGKAIGIYNFRSHLKIKILGQNQGGAEF
jgi:hypothetical protein